MARKIFQEEHGYHSLKEKQLAQLRGVLQRRVDQMDRKAATPVKQSVGAHSAAASGQEGDNPF